MNFYRRVPHSGAFNVSLKVVSSPSEGEYLSVSVSEDCTVRALTARICDQEKIPIAHQRVAFQGTLLDDEKTIGEYKLPAEVTLDLDIVPM